MAYSLKVIDPGAAVITSADVKAWARINGNYLDAPIALAIAGAQGDFERRTGRALSPTKFRQRVNSFDGPIYLMTADVASVQKVGYYDADDVLQETTDLTGWTLDADYVPAPFYRQADDYPQVNDNRALPAYVEFTAGFSTCPGVVKTAVLLLITSMLKNPQAVITGTIATELPLGYLDCVALYETGIYGSWS